MKKIILIICCLFVLGCGDSGIDDVSPEIPLDTEEQFARCVALLNDQNERSSDQRQINTLTCFKELALENYPINYCLTFERNDHKIGCLIGFARANHDLHLCEIAIKEGISEVVVDDCIENAMESVDQCKQVQDIEQRKTCEEREPKGIEF